MTLEEKNSYHLFLSHKQVQVVLGLWLCSILTEEQNSDLCSHSSVPYLAVFNAYGITWLPLCNVAGCLLLRSTTCKTLEWYIFFFSPKGSVHLVLPLSGTRTGYGTLYKSWNTRTWSCLSLLPFSKGKMQLSQCFTVLDTVDAFTFEKQIGTILKCLTSILSRVKVVHMERKVSLKEMVAVKTMVNPWLNG